MKLDTLKTSVGAREIGSTSSAHDLIRYASENPPEPIITGLMNKGGITLVHSVEETFKSWFVTQMGVNIADGTPFLRLWNVPIPRNVGILQTEMHEAELGKRLGLMFPNGQGVPNNLKFMTGSYTYSFRRAGDLKAKMQLTWSWVNTERIDVLIIDPANDFFREGNRPNDETEVGAFFDALRNLSLDGVILVRHVGGLGRLHRELPG